MVLLPASPRLWMPYVSYSSLYPDSPNWQHSSLIPFLISLYAVRSISLSLLWYKVRVCPTRRSGENIEETERFLSERELFAGTAFIHGPAVYLLRPHLFHYPRLVKSIVGIVTDVGDKQAVRRS
ncbi:hypothetical protein ARMGADRAFT_738381 [Armillaria gallica]|uniref:Uncharacterized protein n=1 Tax=Armillaria gallica TaxID=47427 RepID=A0A2H3D1V3_ARMGA|nr:hypothetical protein ARMGADRAFT_738381 [Armillaria gallica]